MSMLDWAKKEIELAKKIEMKGLEGDEFDYGGACYDSALKAFEALIGDGHSGMSIGITKLILNRLIEGVPLTPIEDTNDIWNHISDENGESLYQCQRMSSLFKIIDANGRVTYSDNNAIYCTDINTGDTYSSGLVNSIIREMYPITMPYSPALNPMRVYCEDFLTHEGSGDFDTVGVLYLEDSEGSQVVINKYFREENDKWVEIDAEEYTSRVHLSGTLIP